LTKSTTKRGGGELTQGVPITHGVKGNCENTVQLKKKGGMSQGGGTAKKGRTDHQANLHQCRRAERYLRSLQGGGGEKLGGEGGLKKKLE